MAYIRKKVFTIYFFLALNNRLQTTHWYLIVPLSVAGFGCLRATALLFFCFYSLPVKIIFGNPCNLTVHSGLSQFFPSILQVQRVTFLLQLRFYKMTTLYV